MLADASLLPNRRAVIAVATLTLSLAGAAARPASLEKALVLAGMERRALESARTQATALLQGEECRKIFSDFADAVGRPLQEKLDGIGQTPAEYLGRVQFLNGEVQMLCRRSRVQMVTTGKSRYVYVCPQFRQYQDRHPERAPALVIHEALHTLGLGENPPTSLEITGRILARCQ